MDLKNAFGALFIAAIFFLCATPSFFAQAKLPESPIKTIYVVPSSHYDFGFVEPPSAIRERAARHIDEVLRMAEEHQDFRWTIESVWQLNEWLKRQKKPTSVLPKDRDKIARLMAQIRSGRIVLSTAWGSMHTDFLGAEELNRLLYDYTKIAKTYGINSEIAYMNDVPGHPSTVASMLADSGTRYLVTGANTFINSSTDLAPGKVPFYWQAPDGNKVLLWISQSNRGAYVEGLTLFYLDPYTLDPYTDRTSFDMFNPELAGTKSDIEVMEIGVTDLLNYYNKAGYKYDAVMAMYAHDFLEPTSVANLEKAAKMWNSKHDEVKIQIATPIEFLKYIEQKYGSQIPTYRGDWSGLWSEAKTASPRVSARARYAHDNAPAAEALWSALAMTRGLAAPEGNFTDIFDLMFTYDEHSGAGNTGWPQLNSSQPLADQNREYVEITDRAKKEVDELYRTGIKALSDPSRFDESQPAAKNSTVPIMVYNGLSWPRTDTVTVKPPVDGVAITAIREAATGTPAPFDIDENGNAVFIAKNVPSMGYTTFEVETVPGPSRTTLRTVVGTATENAEFKVAMNADGTIHSIFDRKANRELVNAAGERPFNDLLRVEGAEASRVSYPVVPKIVVKKGRQMTEISVIRERSAFPVTRITLQDGLGRVDLRNELDEMRLPMVGGNNNWHDSYYFAFPFNISKDGLKVMRGGQRWFDRFPDDYLPGARWDSVTTQHSIGLTDGKSSVLLAHRQSFHWVYAGFVATKVREKNASPEFPAMYSGKFPLPEATIYSRAVRYGTQADTHDLGIINVPTVEPGRSKEPMVFEYSISGGAVFDPVPAWQMGGGFNMPLRPQYIGVLPNEKSRGFFAADQPNVQIVAVKTLTENVVRGEVSASPLTPKNNKVFIIRLQEFAGRATTTKVTLPVAVRSAYRVSLTEDVEQQAITNIAPLTVHLRPFQTMTLKVTIN